MRKLSYVLPVFTFILGAGGFLIRRQELLTAFESDTGLPIPGTVISYVMAGLSALVILCAVITAIAMPRRYKEVRPYDELFRVKGTFVYIILIACSAAVMISGALYAYTDIWQTGDYSVINAGFSFLAVGTGVILAVLAAKGYKMRPAGKQVIYCVPSLFMCMWLIILYKENTANPVLISYCYACLAYALGALAFYYEMAVVFGKVMPGKLTGSYLAAAFFEISVLAENMPLAFKIALAALSLSHLIKCGLFLRNLRPPAKKRG